MVRPRAWRSGRARRALGGRARFLSLQFQTELRKILLSLIEVAQKLLALSPGAVELFTKANGTRPAGAGGREPRPDPGSPPAASSRSTETGSTQSTWSAFRACSVSCHRPRLCGRGLAAVSGSLRSGSPPACGARARRCAQGPWRTPLPPGPCPASPVPCLARSDAGRGRGRAGGRGGPAAAYGDGLSRGQGREGPPAEPVRRAVPAWARGLVPWGSPQVTFSRPQLGWTSFRSARGSEGCRRDVSRRPARFGVASPSGNGM